MSLNRRHQMNQLAHAPWVMRMNLVLQPLNFPRRWRQDHPITIPAIQGAQWLALPQLQYLSVKGKPGPTLRVVTNVRQKRLVMRRQSQQLSRVVAEIGRRRARAFKALQSLSESLEFSLKESPSKQPPQIKSPLIAQQKLQSAISGPIPSDPPRKKTSLPKRSSPLMSRKPDTLMRSNSYSTLDSFSTTADRVKEFLTLSSDSGDHPGGESNDYDDPNDDVRLSSPRRTESESSRLPVKPDRLHYTGLDVGSFDSVERTSPIPPINAAPETRLRKKSMSLTDLLSIGRDLTSGRDKYHDKNNTNSSKKRDSRLSSDTTDDRGKTTKKYQRFRLGRSKSRGGDRELKDGIASGPDIDKRKATKLLLRDSLMLESSWVYLNLNNLWADPNQGMANSQKKTLVSTAGPLWRSVFPF